VGARIVQIATAIGLFACSACGSVGSLAVPAASTPSEFPSVVTLTPLESWAPYVEPSAALREVARGFVSVTLAYDAKSEGPRDFLNRVEKLATAGEIGRLHRSGRAQLRWWVLRQRSEQVTVRVLGGSQGLPTADRQTLQVEVLRVTRSNVATVRDFVAVTLVVVPTPAGWRVDRADGGGL
jgi:hypothetical protein